jgi:two-component system, NarL family, nitrate/nitrite response regulator NarL
MAKTRVFLIEDNRLLREGIAVMLQEHGGFDVVARAEDGESLRKLRDASKTPDIVLLDLGLERVNSLKLMAQLREEFPEVKVVAMDILPDEVDIVQFVKAGGSGFILKSAALEDYIDTIRAVAEGHKVLPPAMTTSLFTQIVETALTSGVDMSDKPFQLTAREKEIIALISEGLSNKEIATRLHVATHTVKSHVHNILEKLALGSRLQIAAFARKRPPE